MDISRLTPAHAAEYRAVMLQAYAHEPEAFTATVSERAPLPLDWWRARVSDRPDPSELVFGAFEDTRLVGVAGLRFEHRPRTQHKATLFGMAVLPQFRGQGIGRALVKAVLEDAQATPGTRIVQLTVTESNAPARRLYESCGFVAFGTEPFALKIGERFVSKVHMWCAVDSAVA
ncbi:MAG: GNAT family N-acetyltransferase [Rhodothermaceae bacterium]|nr:GNAT family N-acetyltransferase [Rhodothermaceae bacterium]